MERLNFYIVNDSYIERLSKYEKRICYNKNHTRPYIGIVLKVNDFNYFAPFASPKEKHTKTKENLDCVKINGGEYGIINLNNMIPIPLTECEMVDIENTQDLNYK